MIVIRTNSLSVRDQGKTNRTIYLASMLNHFTPVVFGFSDTIPAPPSWEKNRVSYVTIQQVYRIGKDRITGIIFDVNEFLPEDRALINWAKENHLVTIQITDLGLNQESVDFTIDSSVEPMIPYGEDKQGLFGPEFCILHHKYRHFNQLKKVQKKNINNIFLHLEDNLDYRQTRKLVDILSRHGFRLKISLGPWQKKSHKKILRRIYPNIRFVGRVETLARSFFESDVALVKPGESAFFAAACGVPAIYVCSGKKQVFLADTFERRGAGKKVFIEHPDFFHDVLLQLNRLNHPLRKNIGINGKKMVDARGVYRIIDFFKEKNMMKEEICLK